MAILQSIRADHEKQRVLMKILVKTSGDSDSRRLFFPELKDQLKKHAQAEDKFLYAPTIDSDSDAEISRDGLADHQKIIKMIDKLDKTDMSSPAWLVYMKQLQALVLSHLEREEQTMFQEAKTNLSAHRKSLLGNKYELEMQS